MSKIILHLFKLFVLVASLTFAGCSDYEFEEPETDQSSTDGGDNLGNHIATENLDLNGNIIVGADGTQGIFVGTGGNVGVGTTNPLAELDINGRIRVTGGAPGIGKVLTSDADGFASWENVTSSSTTAGSITTSATEPATGNVGDIYYNTSNDTAFTYDGTDWVATNDGGDAATVPALGVQAGVFNAGVLLPANQIVGGINPGTQISAGTIGAGVLLPTTQLSGVINPGTQIGAGAIAAGVTLTTGQLVGQINPALQIASGTIGSGVLLPAAQITGAINPITQLGNGGCAVGQILVATATGYACSSTGGFADNLGNHTATQNLDLATTFKIVNLADPTLAQDAATKAYVDAQAAAAGDDLGDHNATQRLNLGTNRLVGNGGTTGLAIGPTGRATFDDQIEILGGAPGLNKVLVSDAAGLATWEDLAAIPGSQTANAVVTSAIDPVGALVGDIYYNTGNNTLYTFDGTSWVQANNGGTADSVAATGVTPGTFQAGVLLPTTQLTGTISPSTQVGAGTFGAGVLLPAAQISGNLNPVTQLSNGGCAVGQILVATATGYACGSTAGFADNLGNHTATQNLDLATTFKIINLADPTLAQDAATKAYVDLQAAGAADNLGDHNATQRLNLATNKLVGNGGTTGLAITATGNVELDSQIRISGGAPGAGKILVSDATGLATWENPGAATGDNLGNHTASQALDLSTQKLVGNGGTTGVAISATGRATFDEQVQISGGAPGLNKVLVSDAAGLATWQNIASVPGSQTADAVVTSAGVPAGIYQAGDVYYDTTNDTLYTYDGAMWNSSNNGGTADAVAAGNVTPGTFQAGVLLPTTQLTGTISPATQVGAGTFGAGVLLPAAQISGNLNPITQLSNGGCAIGQILVATATGYACGSTAGFADNLGNHTATQNLDLATTFKIVNLADPTLAQDAATKAYVDSQAAGAADNLGDHNATQRLNLATNKLVGNGGTAGVAVSATGRATFDEQVQILGGVPGAGKILTSDAAGLATWEDPAAVAGDNLGNHTATQALNLNGNYLSGDGDAEGVFVDGAGNVGIGTTTPQSALDVSGTGGVARFNRLDASGGVATRYLHQGVERGAITVGAASTLYLRSETDLRFRTGGSIDRMTVDAAGNVGIGTTNPSSMLQVANGIQFGNDTDPCIAAKAGTIRYTAGIVEYCNGTIWAAVASGGAVGDNLGNHESGQNLDLNTYKLVGNDGTSGLAISATGSATFDDQVQILGGAPGLNKVLVSDAAGLATWQNIASVPGSQTADAVVTSAGVPAGIYQAGDVYFDTTNDTLYTYDGAMWNSSNNGGTADAVAATGVTPGTFQAGVLLPTTQLTGTISPATQVGAGTFGAGVLLPAAQISGNINPTTQLSNGGCAVGQILVATATGYACGSTAGFADNLGNHTATTDLDLATNKIINLQDPTLAQDAATKAYVDLQAAGAADNLGDHNATTRLNLATNKLVGNGGTSGLAVTATGNVELDSQIRISGGAPGLNKVLVSDAAGLATWQNIASVPGSQTADAVVTSAGVPAGIYQAGDVYYDTTNDTLYTYDGAMWNSSNNGGTADSVAAIGVTPGTFGAGVLLPAAQISGNINPITQLSNGGCAVGQILVATATGYACGSTAGFADNLGNHTATQNLDLATTFKIINLADPTLAQDAATKAYVDAQAAGAADNLGDHNATQRLNLATNKLVGNGGTNGVAISATGRAIFDEQVQILGGAPGVGKILTSNATGLATWEDPAAVAGDNLGNHTATQALNLNGNYLSGDGDAEGVFVDGAGNVGIGTTTPEAGLHLVGRSIMERPYVRLAHPVSPISYDALDLMANVWSGDQDGGLSIHAKGSTGVARWTTRFALKSDTGGVNARGAVDFVTRDTLDNELSNIEIMSFGSTGNVGIGTTNPSSMLQVANGIQFGNDTDPCIAAKAGTIRYTAGIVEYCNGTIWAAVASGGAVGDNLGNHESGQNLDLNTYKLVGNDGTNGVAISATGRATFDDQIQISGGAPGLNKVLVSDAAGLATWQNIASVPGSQTADAVVTSAGVPAGVYQAGDVYYDTTNDTLYTYDGAMWNSSNAGGTADSVAATGVTPGTFQAGVLLPTTQLTGTINPATQVGAGTFASGVLLPASQISGNLNPVTQLSNGGCAVGQILVATATGYACGSTAGFADNLGNHTATQNLDLATTYKIINLADPTLAQDAATKAYVDAQAVAAADDLGDHNATQRLNLATNKLVGNGGTVGLAVSATGRATFDEQVQILGGTPGAGKILTSDAAGLATWEDPAAVAGDNLGNHTATQAVNLNGNYLSGDGDAEGVFVDGAGNVGIGTPSPGRSLHVQGSSLIQKNSVFGVNGPVNGSYDVLDVYAGTFAPNQDGGISVHNQGATGYANHTARFALKTDGGGVPRVAIDLIGRNLANAETANLEIVSLTNTGRLGIGTTTPSSMLQVANGIQFGNDTDPCIAAKAGTIRYTAGIVEYCNGTIWAAVASGGAVGDNLGNHEVGQNLDLNTYKLVGNDGTSGVAISATGRATFDDQIQISGGAPGLNKVLVSDAAGLATWQNIASVPGSQTADAVVTSAGVPAGIYQAGDVYYDTTNDTLYTYDGAMWNSSNNGGTADSVAATGVTPGTFQAGVLLPTTQLTGTISPATQVGAGTFGAGVLLPAAQISGNLNPVTQLSNGGCAVGQILVATATGYACGSTAGFADNLGNHTATQNLDLATTFKIINLADPTLAQDAATKAYVDAQAVAAADDLGDHNATQRLNLATNKLVGNGGTTGLEITATGNVELDSQIRISGGAPGLNKVLVSDATGLATWQNVDAVPGAQTANAIETYAANPAGVNAGEIYYNVTNDTLYTYDGTSWVQANNGGTADSVQAANVTAGTFGAGVLLPTTQLTGTINPATQIAAGTLAAGVLLPAGQISGDINPVTQLGNGGCAVGQILVATATGYACGSTAGFSDNLGNHTATQNLDLATTFKIVNLADPTLAQDAATKAYVDAQAVAAADDLGDHNATQRLNLATNKLVGNGGTAGLAVSATGRATFDEQVQILGGVPGAGKILTSDAAGLATWEDPAAVAGDNLGNHTASQALDLSTQKLVGNGGTTGLEISATGVAEFDSQIQISGGTPGLNKVLVSDATGLATWQNIDAVPGSQTANAIETFASNPAGTNAGEIYYNVTNDTLYTFDGTSWVQANNGGTADSVAAANVTAGTFAAGVLLPAAQISGNINPTTQLSNGGCSVGQILIATATGYACSNTGGFADNLGNHTATQALNLNGNYLSGDGDAEGVFVANSGNVGIGRTSPTSTLHVEDAGADLLTIERTVANAAVTMEYKNPSGSIFIGMNPDEQFAISNSVSLGSPHLVVNSANGRMGLGTNAPTTDLDVDGQVRIRGGAPGVGKILTSNAAGLASWEDPAAVAGDNLGNHTASQALDLSTQKLVGNGGSNGLAVSATGRATFDDQIQILGGAPGLNKVLVSDATGLATWQNVNAVPGAQTANAIETYAANPAGVNAGEIYYNVTNDTLYTYDGTSWVQANNGGTADSVQAANVTAGTFGAGVLLPAAQLTGTINPATQVGTGTFAAGVLLPAAQISGNINPTTQLSNGGCAVGQILVATATGYACSSTGGFADNLGNHIATQAINLNGNYLSGDGDAEGVFVDVDGNVGIGTTSPQALLQISDESRSALDDLSQKSNYTLHLGGHYQTGRAGGSISFGDANNIGASIVFIDQGSSSPGDLAFYTKPLPASPAPIERLRIARDGNVGIGTTNPSSMLQVANGIQFGNDTDPCVAGKAGTIRYTAGIVEYCNGTIWAAVASGGAVGDNLGNHEVGQNLDLNTYKLVGSDGTTGLEITATGNVELDSQIRISGGAPGLNKVLVSDATGLATWQNIDAVPGSQTANAIETYAANPAGVNAGEIYYNVTNDTLYTFDGTSWVQANNGGTADSVAAANVTAGTFQAGVLLPTTQLTGTISPATQVGAGTFGAGVLLPAAQISGDINPVTQLGNGGCAVGQILVATATGYACGSTAGFADNLGNHTATQALNLNGNYLSGDGDAEGLYVDTTGRIGIGTTTPSTDLDIRDSVGGASVQVDGEDSNLSQYAIVTTGEDINVGDPLAAGWTLRGYGGSHATLDNQNDFEITQITAGVQVSRIRMDSVTGNIGVGTTAPTTDLDVDGQVRIRGGAPGVGKILTSDAAGLATWQNPAAVAGDNLGNHNATQRINLAGNYLSGDNDDEGLFVSTDGNVGIGTATPSSKLNVSGGAIVGDAQIRSESVNPIFTLKDIDATGGTATGSIRGLSSDDQMRWILGDYSAGNPDLLLENRQDADIRFKTNNIDRVVFDNIGNVGIGTLTPFSRLHIHEGSSGVLLPPTAAGIIIEDDVGGSLALLNPSTGSGNIYFGNENDSSAGLITYSHSDNQMRFQTNGVANRMVINSAGNVGIGTVAPTTGLDVSSQIRIRGGAPAVGRVLTSDATGLATWQAPAVTPGDNLGNHTATQNIALDGNFISGDGQNEGLYVNSSGNVGIGTNSPQARFDLRGTMYQGGTAGHYQRNIQDGTGRVNHYWNSAGTATPTFSFAGEDASKISQGGTGQDTFGIFRADGSAASIGDPITWESQFVVSEDGDVGIGTSTPTADLDVNGQVRIRGGAPAVGRVLTSDATGLATWQAPAVTPGDNLGNHTATTNIQLGTNYLSGDGDNEGLYVAASGNVGFGTNTPLGTIHTVSNSSISPDMVTSGSGLISAEGGFNINIDADNDSTDSFFRIRKDSYSTTGSEILVTVQEGGNVGIGAATPDAKLDIDGQIKIRQGAPGAGKVLTSDAAGLATWETPAVAAGDNLGNHNATQRVNLAGNYLSGDGDAEGVFVDGTGNVGIGTTIPQGRLTVATSSGSPEVIIGDSTANNSDLSFMTSGNNTAQISYTTAGGLSFFVDDDSAVGAGFIPNTEIRMFIDGVTGNVGIGTTSPDATLDVAGILELSGSGRSQISNPVSAGRQVLQIRSEQSNSLGAGMNMYGDADSTYPGQTRFFNNNATSVIINNDGNLGVGAVNPNRRLTVVDDRAIVASFEKTDGLNSSNVISLATTNSAGVGIDGSNSQVAFAAETKTEGVLEGIGALRFTGTDLTQGAVDSDFSLVNYNDGNSQTILYGASSGNIGMGTATPVAKLNVQRAGSPTSPMALFDDNSVASGFQDVVVEAFRPGYVLRDSTTDADDFRIGVDTNRLSISIDTDDDENKDGNSNFDDLEAFTILGNGNVGIGNPAPTDKLTVNGNIVASDKIISGSSSGSVALTTNDGGGNANVTFNHVDSTPDRDGNSGRITVNVDSASDAYMELQLASGVTNGVLTGVPVIMRLQADGHVGIGTVNPDVELDVHNGSINAAEICDETNNNCIDLSVGPIARGVNSGASFPGSGNVAGDVFYRTSDSTTYVYNGSSWESFASSGDSNSVLQNSNPTANLTGATVGDIAFNTSTNRLQVRTATSWEDVDGTNGDDLGDHTATQNIILGSNYLSGDGGNEGIFVAANGRVGVGTTTTTETLTVNGSISSTDHVIAGAGSGGVAIVNNDGSGNANVTFNHLDGTPEQNGNSGRITVNTDATTNAYMDFSLEENVTDGVATGVTRILRLQADGLVGIGTGAPEKQLHLVGDGFLLLENSGGDQAAININNSTGELSLLSNYDGVATGITVLRSGDTGIGTFLPTAKLSVNGTANKPGGGSWATFSDIRLKNQDSFKDFNYGLDDLMKLKPIYYNYADENELELDSEKTHVGFVAQDVQEVIPAAVSENSGGYLEINNDPIIWTILNAVKDLAGEFFSYVKETTKKFEAVFSRLASHDSEIEKLRLENDAIKKELAEIKSMLKSSRAPASVED